MKKAILMIIGSLRKNSFNLQLANEAAVLLKNKTDVSFLNFSDIPFMNQDIEFPTPSTIVRIRKEVIAADGLWFFSPEYNHSYTGVLKNLLDWLSRPLEAGNYAAGTAIAGKKAAISGVAGKSAAAFSRERLRELLIQIKVEPMIEETGIALGAESFQTDKLILTKEDFSNLEKQASKFIDFLS